MQRPFLMDAVLQPLETPINKSLKCELFRILLLYL